MSDRLFLVGTLVRDREWAWPHWFRHTEEACHVAGVEPEYAFVADPHDPAVKTISSHTERLIHWRWVEEPQDFSDDRRWNADRYHRMTYLRNELLTLVRGLQPSFFLSLDSDIFLHEQAIGLAAEGLGRFDCVGMKCYMTPTGTQFPSYAMLPNENGGLIRHDQDYGVVPVDVVMAAKLMTPQAYNVDYEWHKQGEDIGWSIAARRASLLLGWSCAVASKHAMNEEMSRTIDVRCGY